MKDLRPLLREDASDFERQLLNAARRELPPPQLQARMRGTLGLTGPVAWLGAVRAALSTVAGKSALGVAVVGLIAGGAVAGGILDVAGTKGEPAALVAPTATVEAPVAPPAVVPVTPRVVQPIEPAAAPEADVEDASTRQLREEILVLDQARGALQRGSRASALQELDRYRERFPEGILSREAAQLRKQATQSRRQAR
jgi:hypothetical protein